VVDVDAVEEKHIYIGLLRLAVGKNKGGGGQGIPPSLTDVLRFEIQGVALVA
jgi:hypothetical protein